MMFHFMNCLKVILIFKCKKLFKILAFQKLPVFTTEEGIKQIKNNLDKINDWKNIMDLIPKFYNENKMKRTGIAGIFAASLNFKERIISVSQKKNI